MDVVEKNALTLFRGKLSKLNIERIRRVAKIWLTILGSCLLHIYDKIYTCSPFVKNILGKITSPFHESEHQDEASPEMHAFCR